MITWARVAGEKQTLFCKTVCDMIGLLLGPLWALHISDNFLTPSWQVAGFALGALLLLFGAYGLREEEIAPTAVLTAAFFVASLIHVKVGPTSAHLLLNGLLGVMLGRRAALAIPLGLVLQAVLLQHGGYGTLGVNSCIMVIPALVVGELFVWLQRPSWVRHRWARTGLVVATALLWVLSLVFVVALLWTSGTSSLSGETIEPAWRITQHPATLTSALVVAGLAAWGEQKLENTPEFPLGLLLGQAAVLLTLVLNGLVLVYGAENDWHSIVLLVFVMHMPLAVIEGVVLGFAVGFLARVKPGLLRRAPDEENFDLSSSLPR